MQARDRVNTALIMGYVWLTTARERDERGDIPGWVLITVMTAGIVAVIWGVAQNGLQNLFNEALRSFGIKEAP